MSAKLFLIPNTLSDETLEDAIPASFLQRISPIRYFLVEEEKAGRRFLKKLNPSFPLEECVFFILNEHTPQKGIQQIFKAIQGKDAGIISEAGMPCVADPGREIVFLAHQNNWEVIPLAGASSIILALAASGLNGQNFAFNGYLPKEKAGRIKKIKALEERSFREHQTQIFMETPYRNQNLFEDILSCCHPQTLLCAAVHLTSPSQFIKTLTIKDWQKQKMVIPKKPALFLIQTSF